MRTPEKRQCLSLILKKKNKSFQEEICGTEGLGQRKKKINKGRGCGMQGMFGKEKIVWHEGF